MKRIIWHWTAGGHKANATDKRHYHFIIEADGAVVAGDNPVSANKAPISGEYAAHTYQANSDAIGVAVAGMRRAKERPFNSGTHPITDAQIHALAKLTAKLCKQYNIPVSKTTTLSHAEVQPTLGIKQRNKWDITWLPGNPDTRDAVFIGDILRNKTLQHMKPLSVAPAVTKPQSKQVGIGAAIAIIVGLIALIVGSR